MTSNWRTNMVPRTQHRSATAVAAALVALAIAAPQPVVAQAQPAAAATGAAPAAAPLPRTSDGHPDLTGMWVRAPAAGGPNIPAFNFSPTGQDDTLFSTRDRNFDYAELDQEYINKMGSDFPIYKPEYWEVVQYNDEVGYEHPRDPGFGCRNPGIVKLGSPTEIVQLPHKVILIYPGSTVWMRQVPIGAKLRTEDEYESVYTMGVPVGRWEGDTLVVETVDFIPDGAWYTLRGFFQSATSKITERFTPTPDGGITYQVTIDDPAFVQPWVRPVVNMRRNPNPTAVFPTPLPCLEHDGEHMTMELGEAVESKEN
jgi:hypothetical protein